MKRTKKNEKQIRRGCSFLLALVLMISAFGPGLVYAEDGVTEPETCEHCHVALTEGAVHSVACPTNCKCAVAPAEGQPHEDACPLNLQSRTVTPPETTGNTTGSATETTGSATETTGSATETTGSATETTGSATETTGSATETTGSATETTGSATETTGSSTETTVATEPTEATTATTTATEATVQEVTEDYAQVNGDLPGDATLEVTSISTEMLEALAGVPEMEEMMKSRAAKFSLRKSTPAPVQETFTLWTSVFDIKIKSDGEYWQPEEAVTVTINGVNPEKFETIKIRHYLDTVDAVKAAVENGTGMYYYAEGLSKLFPAETAAMLAVDPEMTDTICYTVYSSEDESVKINEDGSVSFETDSFSIVSVQSDYTTPATDVTTVADTTDLKKFTLSRAITVGEEIYLMWDKKELETISGVTGTATDLRGTWSIAQGTDIVEIESHRTAEFDGTAKDPFEKSYQYFFVKVKALKEGTATLHFTYRQGDLAENRRVTLEVKIEVVGSEFWIRDDIATTGCLVPVTTRTDIVTYEWSKKAGNSAANIEPDALSSTYAVENGVNVALDKGGISATNYVINTYTVKGKNAAGEVVASADFKVMYGNEVLNGGFENTNVKYTNPDGELIGDYSIHAQFPNGYPNLYWLTTGTGAIRYNDKGGIQGDYLGHDIEIFHDQLIGKTEEYAAAVQQGQIPKLGLCQSYDGQEEDAQGYFAKKTVTFTYNGQIITKTYDIPKRNSVQEGTQAAELNCEEYGALYQDVITTPGAELYWQVAHSARFDDNYGAIFVKDTEDNIYKKDGYNETLRAHAIEQRDGTRRDHDHMCVIIMPTEHARKIITKTDIDNLLAHITYKGQEYFYDNATGDGTGGLGGFYSYAEYPNGTADLDADSRPTFTELKGATAVIDGETVTFDIIECKATNEVNDDQPKGWKMNNGTYDVPDGQYLTRFFFVATISVADNLAGGNFIDDIVFSERKPYKVEYYVQDGYGVDGFSKLDALDESGLTAEATASATNMGSSLLSDYSLTYTTINGKTTSNKATTFSVEPPKDGSTPTLRLYYLKKGIAITKNVDITNNTILLDTPKELLENYSVTVNLYNNADYTGDPVATAVIPFSSVTDEFEFSGLHQSSQTVMFKKDGKDFVPEVNTTYYAKETAAEIADYTNDGLEKAISFSTDANGIATPSITNKYQKIETSDIEVEKQVTGNMGDVNKEFIFTIKLLNAVQQPAEYMEFPDTFEAEGATVASDKMSTTFRLKDNDTISLTGIPVGVTLEITEACGMYSVVVTQGTDELTVETDGTGENGTAMAAPVINIGTNEKVIFTNTKNALIDTGVVLDSLPYILILGGVAVVAVFLVLRRRNRYDD